MITLEQVLENYKKLKGKDFENLELIKPIVNIINSLWEEDNSIDFDMKLFDDIALCKIYKGEKEYQINHLFSLRDITIFDKATSELYHTNDIEKIKMLILQK